MNIQMTILNLLEKGDTRKLQSLTCLPIDEVQRMVDSFSKITDNIHELEKNRIDTTELSRARFKEIVIPLTEYADNYIYEGKRPDIDDVRKMNIITITDLLEKEKSVETIEKLSELTGVPIEQLSYTIDNYKSLKTYEDQLIAIGLDAGSVTIQRNIIINNLVNSMMPDKKSKQSL